MRFVGDERAQSIQVGAVLLFAILIIFLAVWQAVVIPNQNEQVEFDHNQEVQSQLEGLRADMAALAGSSTVRSSSIDLGVRYPSRLVSLNPPAASGRLKTVGTTNESVEAVIRNATAKGETGDFWNGTERSFNTGAIAYEPRYNEYAQPPRTVLENGVLLNQFSDGQTLPLTGQVIVDDDRIRIGVLNGSLSLDRIDSASVDLRPVSTQTRTVAVSERNASTVGGNVTIELPTRLNQNDWEELVEGERVHDVTVDNGTVTIEMANLSEGESYDLQLWKVGVGTGVEPTEAEYLTNVGDTNRTVQQGETVSLVVETRDRFNGPKGGVTPTASATNGMATVTRLSDESGQWTVEYTAPSSVGTDTVTVERDFDGSDTNESDERVNFTVNVGSSGTETGDSTSPVFDNEPTASPDSVPESDNFDLTATLNNTNRGGTDIISVKWSDNQGNSGELLASDGELDQPVEAVEDSVFTDNWSEGDHSITVTGTDSNGNTVSRTTTVTIETGDQLSQNEVAFDDTNDNGVYDDGTDTAYTTGKIKELDDSSADLIIQKDIDTNKIDLTAGSVTIRGGVTVSTDNSDGIKMTADGGNIDIGGATLDAGKNQAKPIELTTDNNIESDIDVRDASLISDGNIKATPGANGTLFVNDNGDDRSNGGTYIEDKTGNASTLSLEDGTVQGSPEKGEVNDNT